MVGRQTFPEHQAARPAGIVGGDFSSYWLIADLQPDNRQGFGCRRKKSANASQNECTKKTNRARKPCNFTGSEHYLIVFEARDRSRDGKREGSGRGNIECLLALWPLGDFKFDFLTFFECLEAIHLDGGKMCKQIFSPIVWRDEAKALGIVEPLHCPSQLLNFPRHGGCD